MPPAFAMHDEDFSESGERPSKTRQKKAMHELRDLGAELVELSAGQLKRIDLPEDILAESMARHDTIELIEVD